MILPDDSKAFVTSGTTNQISVIDLKQKVLLTNLALGGPPNDLVLKPDGGEVFGSGDAEADCDGECCVAAETSDELLGVGFE